MGPSTYGALADTLGQRTMRSRWLTGDQELVRVSTAGAAFVLAGLAAAHGLFPRIASRKPADLVLGPDPVAEPRPMMGRPGILWRCTRASSRFSFTSHSLEDSAGGCHFITQSILAFGGP